MAEVIEKKEKMIHKHPTAEVHGSAKIGEGTKIWNHVQIRENAEIGENCVLGKNVYIDYEVKIGNHVKLENNVSVWNGVTLEDDVFVAPSVVFTNDTYPRSKIWGKERLAKTLIRKGASLGANSTILPNLTIGEHALVGAGAVVTKDVSAHALVMGNPARLRGFVCVCGKKLGKGSVEGEKVAFVCEHCNEKAVIDKKDYEKLTL